jgi:hypothetical protein
MKTASYSAKLLVDCHNVVYNTLALEICPMTLEKDGLLRLHVHLVLDWDGSKKSMYEMKSLTLLGLEPASVEGTTRGEETRRRPSAAPMHSYLQLDKPGQLFVTMNCIMFRDFSVNPRWVTKWLLLGKSKWETAEKHYVYCAGNCFGNLRNLQCFRSKMLDYSLLERKTRIQAVLRQEMRLFRTWPVLDERFALFKEQFTKPLSRCKFLVLSGRSCTGKTRWAKWLFGDEHNCYVTNGDGAEEPDLRKVDCLKQKSIFIDECQPQTVIRQKQLFQGPPDEVLLATSATNIESYSVFVSGGRII